MRDVKKGENSGGGLGKWLLLRLIAVVLITVCILAISYFGGVTAPLLSKVEACLVISLAAILILFMVIDAL